MMSVHVEVLPHLHRTFTRSRALGAKAGVVLNPSTPVAALEEVAGDVDYVLVMSVNPGFGGQKFIPHSVERSAACARCSIAAGNARADRGRRRRRPHDRRSAWSPPARGCSSPATPCSAAAIRSRHARAQARRARPPAQRARRAR